MKVLGTPSNLVLYGLIFPVSIHAEGDFERATRLQSQEQRQSNAIGRSLCKERCYGRGKFKLFSNISRPLEAMARCLEVNWHFLGGKFFVLYSSEVWERLEWSEDTFCSFFFRAALYSPGFPCLFLNSLNTKTFQLAKMTFIGQETVRKQQRHNFSRGMYTLKAVFGHFNHFSDLKIIFHTNPGLQHGCCDSGGPVFFQYWKLHAIVDNNLFWKVENQRGKIQGKTAESRFRQQKWKTNLQTEEKCRINGA